MLLNTSRLIRTSILSGVLSISLLPAQTGGSGGASVAPPAQDETVNLNPFVVTSERDSGYVSTNAISATRINTAVKDLPVQVGILNQQYIDDLAATTVAELMKFSAYFDEDSGNRIRGMEALFDGNPNRNGSGVNSPGISQSLEGMVSTDRVEIFKGPSSIINGAALPGGSLNIVTKRARWKDGGRATFELASLDTIGAAFEYNKVLLPGKLAALVSVGGREQDYSDTFKYFGTFNNAYTAFLASTWRYGRSGEVAVDVQYDRSKVSETSAAGYSTFGINGGNVPYTVQFPGFPANMNYAAGGRWRTNTRWLPTISWNHRVGDRLSLLARYSRQDRHQYYYSGSDGLQTNNPADPGPRYVRRNWRYTDRNDGFNEVEFRGLYTFKAGPVESKIAATVSRKEYWYWWDSLNDRDPATLGTDRYSWYPFETLLSRPASFYSIDLSPPANLNMVRQFIDDTPVDTTDYALRYQGKWESRVGAFHMLAGVTRAEQNRYGGRHLFTNGVENPATVGIGNIRTDARTSDPLPSVGVVYQPDERLSVYVAGNRSYTFQFRRNSFNELLPNTGGKSLEVGVKLDLGRVVGSIGYYDSLYFDRPFSYSNYAVKDATVRFGAGANDTYVVQSREDQVRWEQSRQTASPHQIVSGGGTEWFPTGEFVSSGIDADLVITPVRNWQGTLTYLYTDAKVRYDPNPQNIGRRENGNAEHTLAFFTNYQFERGPFKGLVLGGGYRWSSKRVESYQVINGATELYERDGSNTLDLFGRYRFRLLRAYPISVQMNVKNLLREERWIGLVPGTQLTTREFYKFSRPVEWTFKTILSF
jgi:iron complex outermembrane recepter protein